LARPNPLLSPNHARMVVRVCVGREDRLAVPFYFVVFFLAGPGVLVTVLLVVLGLVHFSGGNHLLFEFSFDLLAILIFFNFNLTDLLTVLSQYHDMVLLRIVTMLMV